VLYGTQSTNREKRTTKHIEKTNRRWENAIQINHKERRREGVDWIYVALGGYKLRDFVNTAIKLRVP
jgi:hypothetical protein